MNLRDLTTEELVLLRQRTKTDLRQGIGDAAKLAERLDMIQAEMERRV
jgi:hypothetical protein